MAEFTISFLLIFFPKTVKRAAEKHLLGWMKYSAYQFCQSTFGLWVLFDSFLNSCPEWIHFFNTCLLLYLQENAMLVSFFQGGGMNHWCTWKKIAGIQKSLVSFFFFFFCIRNQEAWILTFLRLYIVKGMFVKGGSGNHCSEVHPKLETWLICTILSLGLSCLFIFI